MGRLRDLVRRRHSIRALESRNRRAFRFLRSTSLQPPVLFSHAAPRGMAIDRSWRDGALPDVVRRAARDAGKILSRASRSETGPTNPAAQSGAGAAVASVAACAGGVVHSAYVDPRGGDSASAI